MSEYDIDIYDADPDTVVSVTVRELRREGGARWARLATICAEMTSGRDKR